MALNNKTTVSKKLEKKLLEVNKNLDETIIKFLEKTFKVSHNTHGLYDFNYNKLLTIKTRNLYTANNFDRLMNSSNNFKHEYFKLEGFKCKNIFPNSSLTTRLAIHATLRFNNKISLKDGLESFVFKKKMDCSDKKYFLKSFGEYINIPNKKTNSTAENIRISFKKLNKFISPKLSNSLELIVGEYILNKDPNLLLYALKPQERIYAGLFFSEYFNSFHIPKDTDLYMDYALSKEKLKSYVNNPYIIPIDSCMETCKKYSIDEVDKYFNALKKLNRILKKSFSTQLKEEKLIKRKKINDENNHRRRKTIKSHTNLIGICSMIGAAIPTYILSNDIDMTQKVTFYATGIGGTIGRLIDQII